MSGIVEFIIKMQDELTPSLTNVSKHSLTANNNLSKLTESNKQLKTMVGHAGRSVTDLKSRIAQLKEFRNILPES
ncbi:MAG: hypothetical protein H0X62_05905, partial [Bacteroidetes bacterium]|nr:hypothetical protein [Bacteroidota bacterium]